MKGYKNVMEERMKMKGSFIYLIFPALLFGCISEKGVKVVDIAGKVVIPSSYTIEVEPNDDADSPQELGYIDYFYTVVGGTFTSVSYEEDILGNITYTGDFDFYAMSAPFEGDVTFTLESDPEYTSDYDLFLYIEEDEEFALLASSTSGDENVTESITITTEWGYRYLLLVVGKESDDPDLGYTLTASGISPVDTLSFMVGAYLSPDMNDLGDPLGGTTTSTWYQAADEEEEGDEDGEEGDDEEEEEAVREDLNWYSDFYIFWVWAVTREPYVYEEYIDSKDNDCEGMADDGKDESDLDGDGVSIAEGDCNDTDPDVHPLSEEVYDGKDNDCNSVADDVIDMYDRDGDGYTVYDGDCNDLDAEVYPGAEEVEGDGKDNDCDGVADDGEDESDWDGDGVTISDGDCNDTDEGINPDEDETVDGVDNDCSGVADDVAKDLDEDGDGISVEEGDCNDTDPSIYPGIIENTWNYIVDDDLDYLYLFAGEFSNLNAGPLAGGLRSFEPTEVDLTWTEDGDVVEGVTVTVNYRYPEFGNLFREEEPNDTEVSGWAPGDLTPAQHLGTLSYGKVDKIRGEISSIVQYSWSGDNDLFSLDVPSDGTLDVVLEWEDSGYDYDFEIIDSEFNIVYDGATMNFPETASMEVVAGEPVYIWVIGYTGNPSDYMVTLYLNS